MSTFPAWAVPGQRVVCIDANVNEPNYTDRWDQTDPVKDGVYTIRNLTRSMVTGLPCIGLRECDLGACWDVVCFRPAVEDSDELGIETQLYRAKGRKSKAPVRESERA